METHIFLAWGTHLLWGLGTPILRVLGTHMLWALGTHFPFKLWAGGGPRGDRGPRGTFNTLRLVGRKLLSNIIDGAIAFLASVIVFAAAVI